MQSLVTWAVEVDDIPKEPKRFCVLLRNRSELNKYYTTKSRDSNGLRDILVKHMFCEYHHPKLSKRAKSRDKSC